jgi:hypothetical protein
MECSILRPPTVPESIVSSRTGVARKGALPSLRGAELRPAVPGDQAVQDRGCAAQDGQLGDGVLIARHGPLQDFIQHRERVRAAGEVPRHLPEGVGDRAAVAESAQRLLDSVQTTVTGQGDGAQPVADPAAASLAQLDLRPDPTAPWPRQDCIPTAS